MDKSYYEIRASCKLMAYLHRKAGDKSLYIEVYEDDHHEYRALFAPVSESDLPLKIIKHEYKEFN